MRAVYPDTKARQKYKDKKKTTTKTLHYTIIFFMNIHAKAHIEYQQTTYNSTLKGLYTMTM